MAGSIRDAHGEGIPDCTVVVSNEVLNIRRVMQTTLDGIFDASALPPSAGYRLKVTRKGFVDTETDGFEVSAGQRMNFAITLKAVAAPEAAAVHTALPVLDTTTDGAATLVTSQQMEALPTPERRWQDLALLGPLVTTDRASGAVVFLGDPLSYSYLTDAIFATNTFLRERLEPAGRISQDAVQGFEVLASGYPVEFGHTMGGNLNAVTRTGSNALHGTAYEYYSGHFLNATDRYALGESLFKTRNQAGGSVGGPLRGDKLFFFGNVEFLDSHFQGLNRITTPLIADPTGRSVLPSNCKATAAQCAAAIKFVQSQMNVLVPLTDSWVTGLARFDYRRSERNSLSFEANASHSRSPEGTQNLDVAPNGGLLGDGYSKGDNRFAKVDWTGRLGGSALNDMRFGVFQDRIYDGPSQALPSTANLAISVAGATVGTPQPYSSLLNERRFELTNNFQFSGNAHTVLIGVDWLKTRDGLNYLQSGAYTYPSLTAFAQDFSGGPQKSYTNFTQQLGNPIRDLNSSEIAVYVQDAWQFNKRLRVTYGVRYEKPFQPQPTDENTTYYLTASVPSSNSDADPRVAASYTLGDRTVVRASFGMFHTPYSGELLDGLFLGNGVYQNSILVSSFQSGSPVFPKVLSTASVPINLMYASAKLRNPYTKQSTVSIERRLGFGTTLTASYVGASGTKLLTASDVNLTPITNSGTYTIDDASGNKVGTYYTYLWTARNDSRFAHIYQIGNGGSSWYRALAIQLRKPMSHGLSLQASYTWSHAIDDVGGPLVSGAVPSSYYDSNQRVDLGSSATDQRHRVVVNAIWQPKGSKSAIPAARVLNGWEISAIATLASGQPATAAVLVNGQQFSPLTMEYTNSLNGSGGWSRVPFLPVNSLYSQPEYVVNARLARTFPLTERFKGKLMFEAFNLLNTPYNTGVNTVAYTATAGILQPVPGVGTGNASHGYPFGTNARSCQVAFRLIF